MVVGRMMTRNPFTVDTDTPVTEAQALMRREKIHRLPVLNKQKTLVGIISEKDLLYASPSPASTLNVYEMSNLLARLRVDKVMTKNVITVNEDTPIEDAARIMADNNIGGVPVMRGEKLVGIITESDIFKLFIEIFGVRKKGLRVTLLIPEQKGELSQLSTAIADNGGNIISLGTFPGDDPTSAICIMKVEGVSKEVLVNAVEPLSLEIMDIREL